MGHYVKLLDRDPVADGLPAEDKQRLAVARKEFRQAANDFRLAKGRGDESFAASARARMDKNRRKAAEIAGRV